MVLTKLARPLTIVYPFCDNIEDIDSILLVRGYEPLANALGYENIQIRDVVEKILAGEEIPRKDRATIFGNSCC